MVKTSKKKSVKKTYEKPNRTLLGDLKHIYGRPPKFNTAEEMQLVIMEYFAECNDAVLSPTMSGLAMRLNMGRQTLVDYSKKDVFWDTIKKARQYVESCNENMLIHKKTSPIGNIFNLKNNFGWRDDKQIIVEHKNIASIMAKKLADDDVIDGELSENDGEQTGDMKFLA